MAQARRPLTVLMFLAAVFCADCAIFVRWVFHAHDMDLLSFALATLNILGLVLLGRAILFSARVLYVHHRTAAASSLGIGTSGH